MTTMTVLSDSTVAFGCSSPGRLEVWDWREGKCLHSFGGFGAEVTASALFADGRLIVADTQGCIRIVDVAAWESAEVISEAGPVVCILTTKSSSFFTADRKGVVKLWRDGLCVAQNAGSVAADVSHTAMAVVGNRLIAVGSKLVNSIVVFE